MSDPIVSIKVMRLYSPTLTRPLVPTAVHCDISGAPLPFIAPTLMLPEGFGSIYSGQRFASYITALNQSDRPLSGVTLAAELQLEGGRKVAFADAWPTTPTVKAPVVVQPGESIDFIVSHVLGGPGAYTLKVTVTYTEPSTGMPKETPKYYRFSIVDLFGFNYRPVFVKTPGNSDAYELFVEVEVTNSTTNSVCLQRLHWESVEGYTVELIDDTAQPTTSTVVDPLDVDAVMKSQPILAPDDVYQAVFRIRPAAGTSAWPSQATLDIGRVSINYRMLLGEDGSWSSQPLVARTPIQQPLSLSWEDVPSTMRVDQLVTATLIIRNRSNDTCPPVRLQYDDSKDNGIVTPGVTSQTIGPIPPRDELRFTVMLLGLKPGWHTLNFINIASDVQTDQDNAKTIEAPSISGVQVKTNVNVLVLP